MKIEIKSLAFGAEATHQETLNFAAVLLADGIRIAHVSNSGRGGSTSIYPEPNHRDKFKEAEAYCLSLPEVPYGDGMEGAYKQTLESVVDDIVNQAYNKKQIAKMKTSVKKRFKQNIIIGNKKQWEEGTLSEYFIVKYSKPLEDYKKGPKGIEFMKNSIKQHTLRLEDGQAILNDNISIFIDN